MDSDNRDLEFNRRLGEKIEAYWRERGKHVKTYIVEEHYPIGGNRTRGVIGVRSTIVGGKV